MQFFINCFCLYQSSDRDCNISSSLSFEIDAYLLEFLSDINKFMHLVYNIIEAIINEVMRQMGQNDQSSRKRKNTKGLIELTKVSLSKNKQINETQMTKNDEDAQPVLQNSVHHQILVCPKCNYQGSMNKQYKMGCVSWTWFSCLLLTTIVLSPIAFFVQSCKDTIIYCPMCGQPIDKQFARCL